MNENGDFRFWTAPTGLTRPVRGCLFIGIDRKWPTDCQNDAIDPLLTSVKHVFAPQQSPLGRSSDIFGRPQKL